jgi:lysozyme
MASISPEGIDLIKRFEGLRLEAYQDVAGIWTIGYGHTGPDVHEGQVITEAEAEELLRRDLQRFEDGVDAAVRVPFVQSMFDALVSLSFNIGVAAMRGSTAIKRMNKRDYIGAAEAITWWNKARINGVLQEVAGLTRRRAAEAALYLRDLGDIQPDEEPRVAGAEIEEDSPRRSNPITTRTTAGATAAGAGGAAAAGAVVMDNDEEATGTEVDREKVEDVVDEANDVDADGEPMGDEADVDDVMDGLEGDTADPSGDGGADTDEAGSRADDDAPDEDAVEERDTGTGELIEVPADAPDDVTGRDLTDAVVIGAGVIAVAGAIYVIGARIDDWRKFRR